MAKKNNSNMKIIIPIVSAIVGIGLLVGSYFIGYNVAKNELPQPVTAENGQYGKLAGVYKRSYYNNYNKSVDSYAILWEDGTCRYIDAIRTDLSTTLDFSDKSQQDCKYTYDDSAKSGKIEITTDFMTNGKSDPQVETLNFTFNSGSLMIGGASYGKIQ